MTTETAADRGHRWHIWVWAAFVVLVLYPLSYGPAFWVMMRVCDYTGQEEIELDIAFYQPLVYICDLTGARGLLNDYFNLFL